jgi:hypothetical protein
MRIASLIVGLVLSVVAGFQSFAVYAASSISDSLSEKSDPSATTSAGAVGMLAAFVMFIAAAFALAKPKVARWTFAAATVLWMITASVGGFSDGWIWAVASSLLSLASWRGVGELERKREREREELRADLVASLKQASA